MPTPRLSDELAQEAARLLVEHGGNISHAASAAGLDRSTYRSRLKHAGERGFLGTKPVLPGFRISQTTAVTNEDGDIVREFIQQRPERGDEFEAPAGHAVKGVSALVDADGRVIQQWIKTRANDNGVDPIEAIKAAFEEYRGRAELVPAPDDTDDDYLCVYPIADQHNGLMAWGRETGEAYDLKIGAERLRTTMAQLVEQSRPARQALILNLGDWTHQDDNKNMTPRSGNILDVDGRYFKVVATGVRLMMDCIDLALAKHETVLVRNVPGNHDPHASVALTVALATFYEGNPRVTIDDDPSDWFFHRFGQTLIGANHGHKARAPEMAMTMAVRRREDWGATRYHWMLFGHIHHETVKEVGDVRCESFQTLAAKDAHSHGAGYNSGQSLNCITLHAERGEVGRHRINIAPSLR